MERRIDYKKNKKIYSYYLTGYTKKEMLEQLKRRNITNIIAVYKPTICKHCAGDGQLWIKDLKCLLVK